MSVSGVWAQEPVLSASPATALSLSSSTAVAFQWRSEPQTAFRVGESISYTIKYGFVPAGRATMSVTAIESLFGRTVYHILSTARTHSAMDAIFKVRDQNESWMDVQSLCSLQFEQNIREGLYRRKVHTTYDHPAGQFIYLKWRKGKEYRETGEIPPFVQDVLSSLYYIRTRPLKAGESYTLAANSGASTWSLLVNVTGIETIRVPAGNFECFHLEPILAGEGIFQAKGRLEVWVTNDERRIPVLLRSKVMVGAFDVEMTEYQAGGAEIGPTPSSSSPSPEEDPS